MGVCLCGGELTLRSSKDLDAKRADGGDAGHYDDQVLFSNCPGVCWKYCVLKCVRLKMHVGTKWVLTYMLCLPRLPGS